jgi:hypothetical protein
MKYTVVWKPEAERRLAQSWLSAKDRTAVSKAADQIDAELRHDAHLKGESRDENTRVLLIHPMGVFFRVDAGD